MIIVKNKKAYFDYFIEDKYEAGLVLRGWEAKAVRAGRAQLAESYIVIRKAEVFLIGAHFSALQSASTHVRPDPTRTRKLLLKALEIGKLIGKVERSGYSLVPLDLHFLNGYVKINVGLGKGKKHHDKRASIKEKEWKKEEQRIMKQKSLNK